MKPSINKPHPGSYLIPLILSISRQPRIRRHPRKATNKRLKGKTERTTCREQRNMKPSKEPTLPMEKKAGSMVRSLWMRIWVYLTKLQMYIPFDLEVLCLKSILNRHLHQLKKKTKKIQKHIHKVIHWVIAVIQTRTTEITMSGY